MSEQVPTITDTTVDMTVRQPVDSEAVSSTADATGRLIVGPHVCMRGGVRMCCNVATKLVGVAQCYCKHALKGRKRVA